MKLEEIIDLKRYPIMDDAFKEQARQRVANKGALAMPGFLTETALNAIREEGEQKQDQAFFSRQLHNVYLTEKNPEYPDDHAFNRQVESSKGCITDDIVGEESELRVLYNATPFKDFLSYVFGEDALYPYADPLSSINLHYAKTGQELGWHFDNSSFAITLMIQPTEKGGQFEYIKEVRDADAGEMNFDAVNDVLDGKVTPKQLSMDAGALVLFRGRNAIHRVTPNEGERTRMLVVLAYNSQPNIALSESARMTFYGKLGE
ncbi:hypothetical protein OO007_14520 [Cocleimonas sp. KMM 6892]|uniref:HalD/BesD family halogenase n=1 Tax=unclassified Cocleimonas TaxID=2639732 RepID=UPI002DB907CB|nr:MULTISPECIES: hypothetical protein [unclassified Cocleimonas]MEB8433451.1 hypothetical protein [Cocleimonas sp. KMM 6892]MEC4716262.1 hypothetical protein [Cocleimonas sp. KMM 6895]MEC4745845.1 hypothetical protein [Cocleimonas sp. KMM 6896]